MDIKKYDIKEGPSVEEVRRQRMENKLREISNRDLQAAIDRSKKEEEP